MSILAQTTDGMCNRRMRTTEEGRTLLVTIRECDRFKFY